jgi:chemotaxis protein methyltransferase CheR
MQEWSSAGMARVAELVRERTGLVFPSARVSEVESTVRRVMSRHSIAGADRLLTVLEDDAEVRDGLVAELTIGETYFSRDTAQFELLRRRILPELLATAGAERPLRIWSAGCASGEEPYSIAMILDELGALRSAEIVGTDISRPRLDQAQRAVYARWSLRGVPDDVRDRYFAPRGRYYELAERIRRAVDFRYLNLAEDRFPSLSVGIWGMDLIFCRNVLIYFDRPTVQRVARRLIDSLSQDGWLVLGASDPSLRELVDCDVVVTDAGLVYKRPGAARVIDLRRRGGAEAGAHPSAGLPESPPDAAAGPWPELDSAAAEAQLPLPDFSPPDGVAGAWPDLDSAAAEAGAGPTPESDAAEAGAGPTPDSAAAEAGAGAGAAPDAEPDPGAAVTQQILDAYALRDFDRVRRLSEVALRQGTIGQEAWLPWLRALANQGCHEAAVEVAERAMAVLGATAELLYLRAVLLLQSGDAAAAAALARRSLYMDRDLVVAHLTLAEAQRRLGNEDAARRSLRNAAALLQALPEHGLVPGSDGERAGRLAELVRVKLRLLSADGLRRQA